MEKTKQKRVRKGPRSKWCARCRRLKPNGKGKFPQRRSRGSWTPEEAKAWAIAREARRKRLRATEGQL